MCQAHTPAALYVLHADEIDAIAPKRETAQREMERRIVAQVRGIALFFWG